MNVSRIRAIKARGGRLTGDMVAALIDDDDITFRFCRCGHGGFQHDATSGDSCWVCPCKAFVERDQFPKED